MEVNAAIIGIGSQGWQIGYFIAAAGISGSCYVPNEVGTEEQKRDSIRTNLAAALNFEFGLSLTADDVRLL